MCKCLRLCLYRRRLPIHLEWARIGIHRFGFTVTDIDGNEGAAIFQSVSGILSEYIRYYRVEPDLFEVVSLIDHRLPYIATSSSQ